MDSPHAVGIQCGLLHFLSTQAHVRHFFFFFLPPDGTLWREVWSSRCVRFFESEVTF